MSKKNSGHGFQRRIKSFVCRQGRTSAAQLRAFAEIWPHYGLCLTQGQLDLIASFGRAAPLIVEIGFGNGQSLLEMAQAYPEQNFVGIEVYRPGVVALLSDIEKTGVKNIRIYHEDAVEILQRCISDDSIDRLQLYFPDPWPKKRHHKRRIIQPDFVAMVHQKLKPGGIMHIATDWQPYAEHIIAVMASAIGFINTAGEKYYNPRPSFRPQTKYELWGIKNKNAIFDLIFIKHESSG